MTSLADAPRLGKRKIVRLVQRCLMTAVRWGWFCLLLLVAFGFLAAGLSEERGQRKSAATVASSVSTDVAAPSVTDEPPTGVSDDLRAAIERVNAKWRESLDEAKLAPAETADWMTVGRRISLALVGSGMSVDEIRELERYPEADRVSIYLERLLRDRRFHDYWAERWTRFLVGADDGPFVVYRRRRFRTWLAEEFQANRRYDEMVRRLITAEGLWTDRPEVNFLTVTYDSGDGKPDPIRLAARTSRAFLGLRIDCLQCHDDFLGNVSLGDTQAPRDGVQQDFHQLAAFFSAAKADGLKGIRTGDVDYKYKYLHDEVETDVQAGVPYSPELLPAEGDPRRRLASWITDSRNRQASRAAVSRVWALLFGRAAGDSVDDMPLAVPSTAMIEALTDEFIATDRDLRELIRMIVYSHAFRVDSRAEFEILPEHERLSAVFPLVRLRSDQIAGSIVQSSRVKAVDGDSSLLVKLQKLGTTNDFVQRYGDMGEDEFNDESVTITQRLVMLNGSMVSEHVDNNPVLNASSHITMFARDDAQAIETTYLSVLNRYPSEPERTHFLERFTQAGERQKATEDLFWILINSTEFAWNH